PLSGLVVNRVHEDDASGVTAPAAESAAARLQGGDATDQMTSDLLTVRAERLRVGAREGRQRRTFTAAHPSVATVSVAALSGDVHDLDALREIGRLLAG
ncbi:MAG: ArsA family ATPase, partial [Aeromicrobium sp.]